MVYKSKISTVIRVAHQDKREQHCLKIQSSIPEQVATSCLKITTSHGDVTLLSRTERDKFNIAPTKNSHQLL
ncbi:unnamed protein product [Clavelina lepadiformis]|uniref:Uncharacterized protein n=1 Tax=Clavelina lepadiformis TaxID=159417 RepID=A0ABP0F544_CLALP